MKRIVIVAALAALAACSEAETEADTAAAETEATKEVAAAPAEATSGIAADGQPTPGMYRITTADGQVFMEEVKADGTYVQTDADGKVVETGKWNQKSPTQYCYTKDEEGAVEECNTESMDAQGVWTSTGPEGKTAKVERVQA